MTTRFTTLTVPAAGTDGRGETGHRRIGFGLAVVGLVLAAVTLVANLVAAGDVAGSLGTQRWSFGLTTLAFGTIKLGIAVILIGILIRLWHRVESVKGALVRLKADAPATAITAGVVKTAFGPAEVSSTIPRPLPVHRMARAMWFPMLAMGTLALVVGTGVSFGWANRANDVTLGSWTQGLQFLGEALVLSGIAFLLGSILASLREGGGQVQEGLGLGVVTLKMPITAKVFVALMMLGLMLGVVQFILYLVVAGGASNPVVWFAWLGPLRELSLGLLLAAIVMALVTIGNVLAFQFSRIRQIITTGH